MKGGFIMFETVDTSERKGNGFDDLTGLNFSRLTVLGLSPKKSGRKSYWVCKCECGNSKLVRSDSLKSGDVQSCGCLKKEQDRINLTTHHRHFGSGTRLYHEWQHIKYRCLNENSNNYDRYGGRGIKVCDEWQERFESFRDWALENGYSDDLTIDRIDVNGNYEPKNCQWIPLEEQANNRTTTVWVSWNGKTQNLTQWADELGFNRGTLNSRYNREGLRPPELFYPIK